MKTPVTCTFCGTPESVRAGRKFCSEKCMGRAFTRVPLTKRQGQLQAQNTIKGLTGCERCGATPPVRLERHHKDRNPLNNSMDNLEVLCARCHRKEHEKDAVTLLCGQCGAEFACLLMHLGRRKLCALHNSRVNRRRWGKVCQMQTL